MIEAKRSVPGDWLDSFVSKRWHWDHRSNQQRPDNGSSIMDGSSIISDLMLSLHEAVHVDLVSMEEDVVHADQNAHVRQCLIEAAPSAPRKGLGGT